MWWTQSTTYAKLLVASSVSVIGLITLSGKNFYRTPLFSIRRMHNTSMQWSVLCADLNQLRPDNTMIMGQCFNWQQLTNSRFPSWVGVLSGNSLLIRQVNNKTEYLSLSTVAEGLTVDTCAQSLHSYFQLDHNLNDLYTVWRNGCDRMQLVTASLQGVRVVRQDPWECLVSFICSSNNNISRITQMLSKLRAKYGTHLCTMALSDFSMPEDDTQGAKFTVLPVELPSTGASDLRWVLQSPPSTGPSSSTNSVERYELYSFPTVDALAAASEEDLRALGMGYRAKFIVGTAQMVQAKCRAIALSEGRIGADTVDTAARCLDGRLWFDELRAVAAQAAAGEATDYGPSSPFPVIKTTAGTVALKHAIKKEALTEVKIESSASLETARQSMDAVVTVGRLRVQQQLMELPGVGRKVADCVALFSLDQTSAVPVDTHVWNIAIRDYAPSLRRSAPGAAAVAGREDGAEGAEGLVKAEPSSSPASAKSPTKNKRKASASIQVLESAADVDSLMPQFASPSAHSVTSAPASASVSAPAVSAPAVSASPFIETKSLTPGVYEQVGQVFRDRFGQHAGWAHSVLFAAELPAFRSKLPADLQREMLDFTLLQRSAKKAQRDEKASKNGGSKFNSPSALPMELEGQSDEERKRSSTPPKKSRK